MDEIEELARHRPDPLPPTAAERAALEEQLMTHITDQAPVREGDPHRVEGEPPAARPRTRRRLAMAGAVAAVALVALAVGLTDRGPEPLRAAPTAAQQLQAIATVVQAADPYPDGPYAVAHRTVTDTGGRASSQDQVAYRVSASDTITDARPCTGTCFAAVSASSADPGFPLDGTAAEVRAAVEQRVDELRGEGDGPDATPWLTLTTVIAGLQHPAVGPAARAELLRTITDVADLSSQPGATTAYGLRGTRFTATAPGGRLELVVDPADGYILEVRTEGRGQVEVLAEDGTIRTIDQGTVLITQSYRRPVAADPLPADVQRLADDVAARHDAIEAPWPRGGCSGQVGANPGGEDWGIDIPDHLAFMHCWLP